MLRLAAASSSRVAGGARAFKTVAKMKEKEAASKAALKATGGRDPYGLFKEAIASPPDPEADGRKRMRQQQRREHRAAYSRALMKEVRVSCALAPASVLWTHEPTVPALSQHHRINGHFTKMIAMREAVRRCPTRCPTRCPIPAVRATSGDRLRSRRGPAMNCAPAGPVSGSGTKPTSAARSCDDLRRARSVQSRSDSQSGRE